jgi:hypothetical protein
VRLKKNRGTAAVDNANTFERRTMDTLIALGVIAFAAHAV